MKNMRIKGMMLFLMTALLFFPVKAEAVGILDTTKEVTLTISCKDGDRGIANAGFEIYQIGGITEAAEIIPNAAFDGRLPKLRELSGSEWRDLTQELCQLTQGENLAPVDSGYTDENGMLRFPQDGKKLEQGLYLIVGGSARQSGYSYTLSSCLVFLPSEDAERKNWNYEVIVCPKFTKTDIPVTPPVTPPEEPEIPVVPREEPEIPTQPQKPEETIEIPKTGDHACLPLWISLCGVCAAQMAGLFLYKRKNRRM